MTQRRSIFTLIGCSLLLLAAGVVAGWSVGHRQGASDASDASRSTARDLRTELRNEAVLARDAGWNEGRKQGRTEMQFLQQYQALRAQATASAVPVSIG